MGLQVFAICLPGTMTGKGISETSPLLFSWEDDKLASLSSRSSVGRRVLSAHPLTSAPGFASHEVSDLPQWSSELGNAVLTQAGALACFKLSHILSCSVYPGTCSKTRCDPLWLLKTLEIARWQIPGPWKPCCLYGGESLHHPWQGSLGLDRGGCGTLDKACLGLSFLTCKMRGRGLVRPVDSTAMAVKLAGIANELSPRSSKAKGDHTIVLRDNDSGFRAPHCLRATVCGSEIH